MGNVGFLGNIHAASSPLFTRFIDYKAYKGVDIRKEIYKDIDGTILDMCCGTGFSTKPGSTAIDTSKEMLRFANFYNPGSSYMFGNAETFGEDNAYDTVTCMFAFHEIPQAGRKKILRNAMRIAKKNIIIADISTNYSPSKIMLSGEPYIKDYLSNVDDTMKLYGFDKYMINDRVCVWNLKL
tara:strand:- start:445 stop:990 length:546 start_codon:yes stop_codon:yes gene_type:complete